MYVCASVRVYVCVCGRGMCMSVSVRPCACTCVCVDFSHSILHSNPHTQFTENEKDEGGETKRVDGGMGGEKEKLNELIVESRWEGEEKKREVAGEGGMAEQGQFPSMNEVLLYLSAAAAVLPLHRATHISHPYTRACHFF